MNLNKVKYIVAGTLAAASVFALTASAAAPAIKGDIDGDGKVTKTDVIIVENYLLGVSNIVQPEARQAADMNNDGQINLTDLLQIEKLIK